MADRFFIAPLKSGMVQNVKPWLIPDDAFEELRNVYHFRGRIRKKFGSRHLDPTAPNATSQYTTRVRILIGTTDINGDFPAVPTSVPGTIFEVGQSFSVGGEMFTVNVTGTPADMLTTSATASGTYDTTTGDVIITGADATTDVYFYPAQPIMGLATQETPSTNNENLVAFDTQFAYIYSSLGFQRLAGGADTWTSSDTDFFWYTNWRSANAYTRYLFVTNNKEPIRYRNTDTNLWVDLVPFINVAGTHFLKTARIVVPWKGRLWAFDTTETIGADDRRFVNRARYSQVGDPVTLATSWLEAPETYGKGGFIDASTSEAIITVEFIKDQLVVYFEKSTWALVYTGNQQLPAVWQQINTELGAESTFSVVPFDKVALGVGDVGIHACNGINTDRIDSLIPDEVFSFRNPNGGLERVAGIRDYYAEQVYWTIPSESRTAEVPWPDQVLVYNYTNGTWAINDESITMFGYFQNPTGSTSPSWISPSVNWLSTSATWVGGTLVDKFRSVVAGNQEGFVFILDIDRTENAPLLQITDITDSGMLNKVIITAINHNLNQGDVIRISNAFFDEVPPVIPEEGLFEIVNVIDENSFEIIAEGMYDKIVPPVTVPPTTPAPYAGLGVIARVSRIGIWTKQYNFYQKQGMNAFINKIDFLVDRTTYGQFTVGCYASFSSTNIIEDGIANGTIQGNSIVSTAPYTLYPQEQFQDQLWHPIYTWVDGEVLQFELTQTNEQLLQEGVAEEDFVLHALVFHASPAANRFQ